MIVRDREKTNITKTYKTYEAVEGHDHSWPDCTLHKEEEAIYCDGNISIIIFFFKFQ